MSKVISIVTGKPVAPSTREEPESRPEIPSSGLPHALELPTKARRAEAGCGCELRRLKGKVALTFCTDHAAVGQVRELLDLNHDDDLITCLGRVNEQLHERDMASETLNELRANIAYLVEDVVEEGAEVDALEEAIRASTEKLLDLTGMTAHEWECSRAYTSPVEFLVDRLRAVAPERLK